MPFYIFTKTKHLARSWEFLEALNDPGIAKEVFANYRQAAEGSDVEVVMVETASLREARERLKRLEEPQRKTLD